MSTRPQSLVETLERVRTAVKTYHQYTRRLSFRLLWPHRMIRLFPVMLSTPAPRTDETELLEYRKRRVLEIATMPAERSGPDFHIMSARYPIEALADQIRPLISRVNVEALLSVNQIESARWKGPGVLKTLGLVLSAGTVIVHEVPGSVLRYFKIDKDTFEFFVFFATVATLAYLAILLSISYLTRRSEIRARETVRDVLTLIAAENGQSLDAHDSEDA
jgi:hypothetical protein